MSAPAAAITEFVLKVHSRCDLRCDHCYVYVHRDQTWKDRPRAISPGIARLAAQRIAEHARDHGLHRVRVILHGGEPLLLGAERLRALLTDLRATVRPAAEIDLVLQSNGILLDEELCRLFVEHGVRVGISLDGDAAANDRHRRFRNGASSHAEVLRALELLRRPEFRPAYGGLLCTIDLANDPIAVYEALLAQRPPRIDLLLPHATWDDPPPRPGGAAAPYAAWLLTVYRRWVADGRPVPIRLFDSLRSAAVGGPSQTEAVGLDAIGLATIETDGAWEQADSLKTAFHGAAATGFHVRTHSLDEVAAHPDVAAQRQGAAALSATCRDCEVLAQCGGGLRAHRYRTGGGFDNPSVYCADLKELILSMRREPGTGRPEPIVAPEPALDALLDDLATGAGSAEAVRTLLGARAAADRALLASVLAEADLPEPAARAWALLRRIDATAPEAAVPVWRHPWLRVWALRHLDGDSGHDNDLGYLSQLAAAAAVRAGAAAELALPVRDGRVHLPGLGIAVLATTAELATLTVEAGRCTVRAPGADPVEVRDGAGPGWRPVLRAGPEEWPVLLDDLDEQRDCHEWPTAGRLVPSAALAWDARLRDAWAVLGREAPQYRPALRWGVRTVAPLAPDPGGARRSATHRDAFAAVGVAATDAPATAILLVHELQHVKLGALLDLCDLADPEHLGTVPVGWRPDPRPVEAALQGIYAHLAVADLWRRRPGAAARASFEEYRRWVLQAIEAVTATGALTVEGRRFVAGMLAAADGWAAEGP
ncbi:FxsB family cyclophane-forming radical SAM/SPASM peptide maturase [Dactylosporangium salmoneum]|uniref:Radical SAM core domain-containing protein n=1 Tax=Dactylosporangium salmoneum TaxID=53361 RepID=A0ABN3GWB7_9ACTN